MTLNSLTRAFLLGGAMIAVACRPAPTPAPAQTGSAAPQAQSGTQVVFLGTGTPLPDPDRSGPATAVVVDGAAYLFDAGAGVVRRASLGARKGIAALNSVDCTICSRPRHAAGRSMSTRFRKARSTRTSV